MVAKKQIRCINKDDRENPYKRITHVGGVNDNGLNWKLSTDQAIREIENNLSSFFVMVRGQRADVVVRTSKYGNKYLKTVSDGEEPNNLLSLYECI